MSRNRLCRIAAALTAFAYAAPAHASGWSHHIPEPDMLALLSIAVAGVVIGRRLASKRPPSN